MGSGKSQDGGVKTIVESPSSEIFTAAQESPFIDTLLHKIIQHLLERLLDKFDPDGEPGILGIQSADELELGKMMVVTTVVLAKQNYPAFR